MTKRTKGYKSKFYKKLTKFRNPNLVIISRNNTKIFIVEDHHLKDGDVAVNFNIGIKAGRLWTYFSRRGIDVGTRAVQESSPFHLIQGSEKGIDKGTAIAWNLRMMLVLIERTKSDTMTHCFSERFYQLLKSCVAIDDSQVRRESMSNCQSFIYWGHAPVNCGYMPVYNLCALVYAPNTVADSLQTIVDLVQSLNNIVWRVFNCGI